MVTFHINRHEVNCLTKEEFERSSKCPPPLVRQSSLLSQSPPIGAATMVSRADNNLGPTEQSDSSLSEHGINHNTAHDCDSNKALALMMQPSVDYGKWK